MRLSKSPKQDKQDSPKNRFRFKLVWIGLGLLTLLIRWIAGFYPQAVEQLYARGLHQGVRWVFDHTLTITPLPLLYVLFVALVLWLLRAIVRLLRNQEPFGKKLLHSLFSLSAFAGGFIFFFMWLWGFNYARIPIEQQLRFQPKPLDLQEIKTKFNEYTVLLDSLRSNIPNTDTMALSEGFLPENLENTMRDLLTATLTELNYPTTGRVRGRLIYPKGILIKNNASGIYIPFIGEGNIDGGLHHLSIPFTMAHEMAHGYGHGDEGTCNFLAYLACRHSHDPYIRYAGTYSYWRYLRSALRRLDNETYLQLEAQLPTGIRNDLEALKHSWTLYPQAFPEFRDWLYDRFLKSQGVAEGTLSYSKVVMMVEAFDGGRTASPDD